MNKRGTLSPSSSWISLVDTCNEEFLPEENVKSAPYYDKYPVNTKFADLLPPDYPAIISLLCSVITICFNVWFRTYYK